MIAALIALVTHCFLVANASENHIGSDSAQSCDELNEKIEKLVNEAVHDCQTVKCIRDHDAVLRAEASLFFTLEGCHDDIRFLILMSKLQMMKGDNEAALNYVNQALLLNENNPTANELKGSALLLLGQNKLGIEYISRAVKFAPDNTDIAFIYCSSLEWVGEYDSAIKVCSEVINTGNNIAAATYIRGRAYDAIGKK